MLKGIVNRALSPTSSPDSSTTSNTSQVGVGEQSQGGPISSSSQRPVHGAPDSSDSRRNSNKDVVTEVDPDAPRHLTAYQYKYGKDSYTLKSNKFTHALKGCWYSPLMKRISTIAIAGTGFLADAYDLFVINIALDMMAQEANLESYQVTLTTAMKSEISMMAVLGAIFGQLIFGTFADQIGRKKIFVTTCSCIILGTILSATVQPNSHFSIYQQLAFWRFWLGFGVGGEYPLSSSITAETSTPNERVQNLALVFSMQGVGKVLCALVLLFCYYCIEDTNLQWRIAILIGGVPMMISIYYRCKMHETNAFEHSENAQLQSQNRDSFALRVKKTWSILCANGRLLAGTAGSWFILDVIFYGNSLFSSDVTKAMGTADNLEGKVNENAIIQAMAMPGYIMAVYYINRIGKKNLQLLGFAATALIFLIMATFQDQLANIGRLYIVLYALTYFFDDFGANTTTFIIPTEVFPTEVRATCHGFSAAMGKLGAVIGASFFLRVQQSFCPNNNCDITSNPEYIENSNDDDANMNLEETYAEASDKGLRTVFLSCALLALLGFFWTWYFITTDQAHESLTKYAESNLSNDLSTNHFDDGVWDTNGVEVELTELDEENNQQSNSSTTLSSPEKAGANTYL